MGDDERNALIGETLQEHKRLKQRLACLATKADRMQKAVAQGLLLISGKTTGHEKDGQLFVANKAHSMMMMAYDWPSVKKIGELVADRDEAERRLAEVEGRLRDMGLGDYT